MYPIDQRGNQMSSVKPKHVKNFITNFGQYTRNPIRKLTRSETKHISLQMAGCKLVICRDGEYEQLPISKRVAEELIAFGFSWDC